MHVDYVLLSEMIRHNNRPKTSTNAVIVRSNPHDDRDTMDTTSTVYSILQVVRRLYAIPISGPTFD